MKLPVSLLSILITAVLGVHGVAAEEGTGPTRMVVHLPSEDAELYIDGMRSQAMGRERRFRVPEAIQGGVRYFYDVRARLVVAGVAYEKTVRVEFASGETTYVKFSWGLGPGPKVLKGEIKKADEEEAPRAPQRNTPNRFTVHLPTSDAELFVEDTRMQTQGLERAFNIPDLDQGTKYVYAFKARVVLGGTQYEKKIRVPFTPGDSVNVRFFWGSSSGAKTLEARAE